MTSHTVTTRGQPPKYAKYLFAGEIGDVPEHNDTLKALLFTELAKSVTKQGENIDKLPEKVTVIGNDGHVLPVKDVSSHVSEGLSWALSYAYAVPS